MGHSALGGALRLINPLFARFAGQPELDFTIPLVPANSADQLAGTPN